MLSPPDLAPGKLPTCLPLTIQSFLDVGLCRCAVWARSSCSIVSTLATSGLDRGSGELACCGVVSGWAACSGHHAPWLLAIRCAGEGTNSKGVVLPC